jgi:hypothetical protein
LSCSKTDKHQNSVQVYTQCNRGKKLNVGKERQQQKKVKKDVGKKKQRNTKAIKEIK